jgi:ankyrin repeat protein
MKNIRGYIEHIRESKSADRLGKELIWAVMDGNFDKCKKLIQAGANVNGKESKISGRTPLHWAAYGGNIDIAKLLIDAGAFVDIKNRSGFTPFHGAVNMKHVNIAKLLIQAGAKINLKTHFNTFKEFSDFFGGDVKWVPLELIPPEWQESAKFTGTFGGFY